MRLLRPPLTGADLALVLLGGAAILATAYLSVRAGAEISIGLLLIVALFIAAVIGFISYPHIAAAATVAMFVFVPPLKVFISPEIGPMKDLVVIAAGVAGLILYLFEGRRLDRLVLTLVLLLLGLYLINAGGSHGIAWAQGVRLVGEPLLLLLVGLILPRPRRTFRFAMGALIISCSIAAAYGILQQMVGPYKLVSWGYEWNTQVRFAYGHLRSIGTADVPFDYAGLLALGVAAVFFWLRRGALAWGASLLMLGGMWVSYVRISILFLVGLVGLVLWRWGNVTTAVMVAIAVLVAGGVILAHSTGTEANTYAISGSGSASGVTGSTNLILNGRVSAWTAALGPDPADWILGRGVGEVGTAAERATYGLTRSDNTTPPAGARAVDSGYLATVADVGLAGLALLLALYGRLLALGLEAARKRRDAGWVALGLLAVVLIASLTGSAFTSFPEAFLGLFVAGIALAAARDEPDSARE